MAGEQAEGAPALVDIRRGGILEAADVVAPEAKAGQTNRQAAAQAFRHRFVVGVAIATPVHRELLRAHRGGTGKQHRFFLAQVFFEHVPHQLVVNESVVVVHFLRVGIVEPTYVGWDALAEVSFEAVDAHLHQAFQLVGVPLTGFRVGEVINRQPRLPFIPLPDRTIRAFEQIALLFQLFENL